MADTPMHKVAIPLHAAATAAADWPAAVADKLSVAAPTGAAAGLAAGRALSAAEPARLQATPTRNCPRTPPPLPLPPATAALARCCCVPLRTNHTHCDSHTHNDSQGADTIQYYNHVIYARSKTEC